MEGSGSGSGGAADPGSDEEYDLHSLYGFHPEETVVLELEVDPAVGERPRVEFSGSNEAARAAAAALERELAAPELKPSTPDELAARLERARADGDLGRHIREGVLEVLENRPADPVLALARHFRAAVRPLRPLEKAYRRVTACGRDAGPFMDNVAWAYTELDESGADPTPEGAVLGGAYCALVEAVLQGGGVPPISAAEALRAVAKAADEPVEFAWFTAGVTAALLAAEVLEEARELFAGRGGGGGGLIPVAEAEAAVLAVAADADPTEALLPPEGPQSPGGGPGGGPEDISLAAAAAVRALRRAGGEGGAVALDDVGRALLTACLPDIALLRREDGE